MNHVADALANIRVGDPVSFRNLDCFPLYSPENGAAEYVTLDEALEARTARITEVSDEGSVPDLKLFNEGDNPVFLLDGEELIGAKQDRVLNLSILAPSKDAITIPVSCVEQGRWNYRSSEFSSSGRTQYSRGRANRAMFVSDSMAESGSRRANQSETWNSIEKKLARMAVASDTRSMSDIYESHIRQVEEYVEHFSGQANQVGAVFAIDGDVVGLDLFDNSSTFEKLLPKILKGYALDAVETSDTSEHSTNPASAHHFLESLKAERTRSFDAVGLGTDIRIESPRMSGGALAFDGKLVHFAAFMSGSDFDQGRFHKRPRNPRASHWRSDPNN